MIAVSYRDPTISRFAIADGVLHIGGLPVGLLAADTDGAIWCRSQASGSARPMRKSPMTRSPEISQATFEDVKAVVVVTLGIEDQADELGPETGLYGDLPELNSLTVVKIIVALQKRFGIEIKIDEIVGDVFNTLGRLAAFVESKVRWQSLRGAEYYKR
jgi:acyl carrier protein